MAEVFDNSYASRAVDVASDIEKLLRQKSGEGHTSDNTDKENSAEGTTGNSQSTIGQFGLAHSSNTTSDYFGFFCGPNLCTTAVNESAIFDGQNAEVANSKPVLLTLKSNVVAAAFCANCACIVAGTENGNLVFATTTGKTLFSQRLLAPTTRFSSIVVKKHGNFEDIIILADDGKLFMFHQINFRAIQVLFAKKELSKLAEYRKQLNVSSVDSQMRGPHHFLNASYISENTIAVAVCSAKEKATAVKFWSCTYAADEAKPVLSEDIALTDRVTEQSVHAGVIKMDWTSNGKWFMLLGAEGRLSWWSSNNCQLVKTMDKFSSVLDFSLLETESAEASESTSLPRIAIQKRRSSGACVEVLHLDGKKIRKVFSANALPQNTYLRGSMSIVAGLFTISFDEGSLHFYCYSDPSIRMQQLHRDDGLDAAMNVATKFDINPVGFLEASIQKLTVQLNELDDTTTEEAEAARHDLTKKLVDVIERIEDDIAAIEQAFSLDISHLSVIHAMHEAAESRFDKVQSSSEVRERHKRRLKDIYQHLFHRWQIYERTFCGSIDPTMATDNSSSSTCRFIQSQAWHQFRKANLVDAIVLLLRRRMIGQAVEIWQFYAYECNSPPDIVAVLHKLDVKTIFAPGLVDASAFTNAFTAWMTESLPYISKSPTALASLRDWIFIAAAVLLKQGTLLSTKSAKAVLSILDPNVCEGTSNVLNGNLSGSSATQVLQRIQMSKVFKQHVSNSLRSSTALPEASCLQSVDGFLKAVDEMIYLHEAHGLPIQTFLESMSFDVDEVSLQMLMRANDVADVDVQLEQHVLPFLQRHSFSFQPQGSVLDRTERTVDRVLCQYVDALFAKKAKLEEDLDHLQPGGVSALNTSSSSTEFVDDESVDHIADLKMAITSCLNQSMRAVRLVEDLDLKSQRALDFLSNLRPSDFSDAIFKFAEDASTWSTTHKEQLLEQRRLLDIYGILSKYGVLSGCSSWAFSVTVVGHARQLLAFVTSQIDLGIPALQDALILADAYREFNKLDVYVDFLSCIMSQPLPKAVAAPDEKCSVEFQTPQGPSSGPGDSIALTLKSRTKLVAKVLKHASNHGRAFRAEICEEIISLCCAFVHNITNHRSIRDIVLEFLASSSGIHPIAHTTTADMILQIGLLAISQLQTDRRSGSGDGGVSDDVQLFASEEISSLRRRFERSRTLLKQFGIVVSPSLLEGLDTAQTSKIAEKIVIAVDEKRLSTPSGDQLAKLLGIGRQELQAHVAEITAKNGQFSLATQVCFNSLHLFENTDTPSTVVPSSTASNPGVSSNDVRISTQQLSETETGTLKRIALAMCKYTASHTSAFDEASLGDDDNRVDCSPEFACQLLGRALVGASSHQLSSLLRLHRAADIVIQVFSKSAHGDFGKLWSTSGEPTSDIARSSESMSHYVDSNSVLDTSAALQKAISFAMTAAVLSSTQSGELGAPDPRATAAFANSTHQLIEYLLDNGAEQTALHVLSSMQCFAGFGFVLSPAAKMKTSSDIFQSLFAKLLRSANLDVGLLFGYVSSMRDQRERRSFRSKFLKNAIKVGLHNYSRLFKLSELGFALSESASGRRQFQELAISAYWWLYLEFRGSLSVDTTAFTKDPKAYLDDCLLGGTDGGRLWGRLSFATALRLADTYAVNRDFVCLRYIEYMLRLKDAKQRDVKRHELVGKIIDLLLTPPSSKSQALQSHAQFDARGLVDSQSSGGRAGGFADFAGVAAAKSGTLLPNLKKLSSRLGKIRGLRDSIVQQIDGKDYCHLRHVFTVVREAELAVRSLVRRCGCDWTDDTSAGANSGDKPSSAHQQMGWDEIRILDALLDCRRQAMTRGSKAKTANAITSLKALESISFHDLVSNPHKILVSITTTDTVDILTDGLIWAPIVRDAVSQAQLCDIILQNRFSGKEADSVWSHDDISTIEADLRRIGNSTPAACDNMFPAQFAVERCEWVAQRTEGALKIKALRVAIDMASAWLKHSQEKELSDQLDAMEKIKELQVILCNARVLHILGAHTDPQTLQTNYEPYLHNPQRLLCLVYHYMSPSTLDQNASAFSADHATVPRVDVHGIAQEIAACYGPGVRVGPVTQHLIKHWLKNGPVPPVKTSVNAQAANNPAQSSADETLTGVALSDSSLSVASSTANDQTSSSQRSGCSEPNTTLSTDSETSPSPFNLHKVMSCKPASRLADADGSQDEADVFDDLFPDDASTSTNAKSLLERTPEEEQHHRHLEVVGRISFVIQAPFGGSTWTMQRRAEFLMEFAYRAHPRNSSQVLRKQDAKSKSKTKVSYEAAAIALHTLFHVIDNPETLEAAAKKLGSSLDQVMTFWQQCMYMRVFDQLRLPYNIDRLSTMRSNPLGFVRGLWRDYRHHNSMLPVIGQMMLDFGVMDTMLWTALLQQMQKLGMYRRLVILLIGLPSDTRLFSSKPVCKVWTTVVRHGIRELDMETANRPAHASTAASVAAISRDGQQYSEVNNMLNYIVSLAERGLDQISSTSFDKGLTLLDAASMENLSEICCRLGRWELAFQCYRAASLACGKLAGDGFNATQLQSMVMHVLQSVKLMDAGAHTMPSGTESTTVPTPLVQFLQRFPTSQVGPSAARMLQALYGSIRKDAADTEESVLIQQLQSVPNHWSQYQKFVSKQQAHTDTEE